MRTPARLLALPVAALLAVTACSGTAPSPTAPAGAPPPSPSPTTSTTPSPSPTPSTPGPTPTTTPPPTTPAPPVPVAWQPGVGEVQPGVKTAAVRVVEAAGTWGEAPGGDVAAVLARADASGLLSAGADRGALAVALAPLAADDAPAAAVRVAYPQYGGLTDDAASVMVVLEQELLAADGSRAVRGTSLDVRVAPEADGVWRVTGVVPPPRRADGAPSALALAVLDHPRVHLPAAAVADVRAGVVTDEVLAVLARLGDAHEVDVSVLRTGHPDEVFGTDRLSNHTRGRAVDVWRVDGRLVVDPAARDVVVAASRAAAAAGATEVGGPVDLDGGPGGGWFSDALHADHLHVGVTDGERPISAAQLAAAEGG